MRVDTVSAYTQEVSGDVAMTAGTSTSAVCL